MADTTTTDAQTCTIDIGSNDVDLYNLTCPVYSGDKIDNRQERANTGKSIKFDPFSHRLQRHWFFSDLIASRIKFATSRSLKSRSEFVIRLKQYIDGFSAFPAIILVYFKAILTIFKVILNSWFVITNTSRLDRIPTEHYNLTQHIMTYFELISVIICIFLSIIYCMFAFCPCLRGLSYTGSFNSFIGAFKMAGSFSSFLFVTYLSYDGIREIYAKHLIHYIKMMWSIFKGTGKIFKNCLCRHGCYDIYACFKWITTLFAMFILILILFIVPFIGMAAIILKLRQVNFVAVKFVSQWDIEEYFVFLGFVNNITSLIVRRTLAVTRRTIYTLLTAVYHSDDDLVNIKNNENILETDDNEMVILHDWYRISLTKLTKKNKKRGLYENDEIVLKRMINNELFLNRNVTNKWKATIFSFYLDDKPDIMLKLFRGEKYENN